MKTKNKADVAPAQAGKPQHCCKQCGIIYNAAIGEEGMCPDCAEKRNSPAQSGQHTPGPWKVIDGIGCGTIYSIQAENPSSGNGVLAAVLHAPDKQRPLMVAQANARLIAAAPELLEALKSCFAMLTSPKFSGWIDANCADDELWAMTQAMIQRRDEARAAIARAERENA